VFAPHRHTHGMGVWSFDFQSRDSSPERCDDLLMDDAVGTVQYRRRRCVPSRVPDSDILISDRVDRNDLPSRLPVSLPLPSFFLLRLPHFSGDKTFWSLTCTRPTKKGVEVASTTPHSTMMSHILVLCHAGRLDGVC
jgi:hypothetical protein